MSFSNAASLYSFKHKKTGVIFTIAFVLIKVYLYYTGELSDNYSRILNVLLTASLYIVAFSKEEIDDERTKQLRYFTLKLTFYQLLFFLVIYGFDSVPRSISFLSVLILLFYIIVFYILDYLNPSYVFGDGETTNGIAKGIIYIFLGLGISSFIFIIASNYIS